ncbi:Melibiase-domain-containing protein [Microdochium trichocladiopsis]|uniref:Alpha-galactosidase n=1 Tax=Microdochium trichocladiopsis TaxID=1682393 RepID=A0A9P8Y8E0_9PEZI|nr:Melibiase-domain-containing protein [Microdochium trichocladiopsis]KAH7030585.1 Melibiase-domain-containing protein [Microdochium trichocladiopsis]
MSQTPQSAISVSAQSLSFALNGKSSSYRFQVDPDTRDLISTHFGGRIDEDVPAWTAKFGVWSPEAKLRRREFPELGRGDFRTPAVHIRHGEGHAASDFKFESHRVVQGKPSLQGLPSTFGSDDEAQTLIVHMRDTANSTSAYLSYSIFAAHDAIVRSVRVVNEGEHPVTIEKLASLSFDLPTPADGCYDLTGLHGEWARERQRTRHRIRTGVQSFGSTQGASSHWHNPFMAVSSGDANEKHGDVWGLALVYSGSHLCEVELATRGSLRASMGIHPSQLSWRLGPGQSFTSPEAVAVYSGSGFGDMSRKLHRLVRHNLVRSKFALLPRPTLLNPWEGVLFNFDDKILTEIAKQSAEIGVKLFVIDDGWFGGSKHPRVDDHAGLGDWEVNPARFPDGLEGFARKIKSDHNLQLGLWVEPEMVNRKSALFEAHPDWVLEVPGMSTTAIRHQFALDLGLSEVQDYIIQALSSIVRTVPVSYIKWDYNRPIVESPTPASHHKYMLGLYRVLEQLTQQHPDILWEGCASGGGRFDLGMLHYFPQIWTSDNTDALDRLHIQLGTSLAYPASTMGAHLSRSPNEVTHRPSNLLFRAHVAMMGGSFGVELDPRRLSDDERAQLPDLIKFAEKINSVVVNGDMYRLSLPSESNHPAVLFMSSEGDTGVLFIFQLRAVVMHDRPLIKLQGLDPDARYILDGDKQFSGATLMNAGVVADLTGDLTSKVLLIKKV